MTEGLFFLMAATVFLWPLVNYFCVEEFRKFAIRGRIFSVAWILTGCLLLLFIPLMAHGKAWATTIAALAALFQLCATILPLVIIVGKKREWGWLQKSVLVWLGVVAFFALLLGLQSGIDFVTNDDLRRNPHRKNAKEENHPNN